MSDDRKPSEDLREGLGLIFRAARKAAKQIDVAKIDKGLDRAVTQAGRVVSTVGRAVSDEINRMAASPPPWSKGAGGDDHAEKGKPSEATSEEEGHVWASQAQQSPPEKSAEENTDEPKSS